MGAKKSSGRGKGGKRPAQKPSSPRPAVPKPTPAASKPESDASEVSTPAKPTRVQRLSAAAERRRKRTQRAKGLAAGTTVALVVIVGISVNSSRKRASEAVRQIEASGACQVDDKFDADDGAGRNHVEGSVAYAVDPPSGGNHAFSPSRAGRFQLANTPTDSEVVHSLEHGYVAIWYKPGDGGAAPAELVKMAERNRRDVLLLPRPSLKGPVAATVWNRRVLCDRIDVAALEKFTTSFVNQGPEKIPHPEVR